MNRNALKFGALELGSTIYVFTMLALAAIAAWPIYQSISYLILVVATGLVGFVLAWLRRSQFISGLTAALLLVAAYLVLGLTLTMPFWNWGLLPSLRGIASGPVTAWQNLLSVDLPVAGYRNLAVPVLLLFLLGAYFGLTLAWRRTYAPAAAPVLLVVGLFGLLFGPDGMGSGSLIFGQRLPETQAASLGLAAFLLSLGWLAWRAATIRAAKLRLASGAVSGAVDGSAGRGSAGLAAKGTAGIGSSKALVSLKRGGAFAGVILGSTLAALLITPHLLPAHREVLRTGHAPDLHVVTTVSPLAQFRRFFTGELFHTNLFQVTAQGAQPDRVRLAVLTDYDGTVFSAGTANNPTQFRRVPWTLNPEPGYATDINISMQYLSEFARLWLPMAGSPQRVTFAGPRPGELRDGFFYDRASASAILTAPAGPSYGDIVQIQGTTAPAANVANLVSPHNFPRWQVPDTLSEWLENNPVETSGAGLAEAISNLRQRGFLSHSVDAADSPWVQDLTPGFQFTPSAAGHSLGRIDLMFRELNERQQQAGTATGAALVATAGDDEQFATAAALIADQMGFPVRIVIGAHLPADPETVLDDLVPVCQAGVCTGGDMSAWIEVQGADGQWAAIDVRPQHQNPISDLTENTRPPEVPTEVQPDTAIEATPPDAVGVGGAPETSATADATESGIQLWPILRAVGLGLGVVVLLLGPPGIIVGAKRLRRRTRRTGSARKQIVGGWDELVDTARDYRAADPTKLTRQEFASALGAESTMLLARESDRAHFSDVPITAAEASAYWDSLNSELKRFGDNVSPWRRLRAELSTTSLLQRKPKSPARHRPKLNADPS